MRKNDKKADTWFENVKPSTGFTSLTISHFTVVRSITWPMNTSVAGSDLALILASQQQ